MRARQARSHGTTVAKKRHLYFIPLTYDKPCSTLSPITRDYFPSKLKGQFSELGGGDRRWGACRLCEWVVPGQGEERARKDKTTGTIFELKIKGNIKRDRVKENKVRGETRYAAHLACKALQELLAIQRLASVLTGPHHQSMPQRDREDTAQG